MLKLYKKNELLFALVSIFVYVSGFSIADTVSVSIGFPKAFTVLLGAIMTVSLYIWFRKNKLTDKYGLCIPVKSKLFFVDVIFVLFLLSANLWNGINPRYGYAETVMYILSMLFVGCLEEVIFRGLLFKALSRESVKTAIIVSSLSFGAGHIVNLFSGADFMLTLMQIFHACIIGYIFTLIFIRTKSLVLCMVAHSLFNSFDAFASVELNFVQILIFSAVLVFASAIYTQLQRKLINV